MSSSRIWERVTLGMGVVCVVAVAVGLGYKVGDYALSALREVRPARTDVVPKPPTMVKGGGVEAAPATAQADQGSSHDLFRVQVNVPTKSTARGVVSQLAETGYDSYVLAGGDSVQVGAFESKVKAEAVARRLSSIGIKAAVR